MKKYVTPFLLLIGLSVAYSNNPIVIQRVIQWEDEPISYRPTPDRTVDILSFPEASYEAGHPTLPYFSELFPLSGNGQLNVEILQSNYEALSIQESEDHQVLGRDLRIFTEVEQDRKLFYGRLYFIPIRRKADGSYEKLVSFELEITHTPRTGASLRGNNTYNSVLNDERIFKIAVRETGMHKMNYSFLKNDLGVNIDGVATDHIKIYGNGGGVVPQLNSVSRPDDLIENAIDVVDRNGNKVFDSGDYILFFAEAAGKWTFNAATRRFNFQANPYDERNYYFLKISPEQSKRLENQTNPSLTSYQSEGFNDLIHFEEDKINVLSRKFNINTQGTGKQWFGDRFEALREKEYRDQFSFSNVITTDTAWFEVVFAGRSDVRTRFKVTADQQEFTSAEMSRTRTSDIEARFAYLQSIRDGFFPASDEVQLKVSYPPVGAASEGFLDYINMNARRRPIMTGNQMIIRDIKTLDYPSTTFSIGNVSAQTLVWDVSNPLQPRLQEATISGSTLSFGAATSTLKTFVLFDPGSELLKPEAIGKIEPQNVHGIDNVDMVIIYPGEYESAAQQLAAHRENYSQLEVATVEIGRIFNEFSSGRVDPSAVRDFAKMIYDRNSRFRYLLLLGDGSYDYRNIYGENEANGLNHNSIVVYETDQSLDPINGFPSDDYFALLSDGEGSDNLLGALDIAVGRLPVRSPEEARLAVEKIINYDTDTGAMGAWRNRVAFVADDQDNNLHFRDADRIARNVTQNNEKFNIDKIYFDAYQQESTSGGEKYPAVSEAINANLFQGLLTINYLGHGGWKGWAQERVLGINDIRSWTNYHKLPLFVTATCSFSGYDEPTLTTGGEEVFLSEKGGAIGLFSTVRAVYASSNFTLTRAVFDTIFAKVDNEYATIGEILRVAKNSSGASVQNSRKFTLLGDPALKLALPEYTVATTRINGNPVSGTEIDTIRALQKVTIEGMITDDNGQVLQSFNGKIFPTIYDKVTTLYTLGQDEDSRAAPFQVQKNVIFKGTASVRQGRFEFTFVVPKDINFKFGPGKISYYATDGSSNDASGYYDRIVIGGTDSSALADTEGPDIEVYMNDTTFAFGGITDPNPVLIVQLADDNGINVVGNSIGHDLTGVLDENTQNTYQLNEFYESALDDYRKGTVRFPLFDLKPGRHQIRVRAWDVANNNAEAYTEFIVAESNQMALDHVLNYPNPFTTKTNFQFEHNFADQLLDIQVSIFTVSGRLVKTIEDQVISSGFRITDIEWDGRDDFGDRLAKGIYLYKVSVSLAQAGHQDISAESKFEKLVILK